MSYRRYPPRLSKWDYLVVAASITIVFLALVAVALSLLVIVAL